MNSANNTDGYIN